MRIVQIILSKGFRGAERHVASLAMSQARHHDVLLIVRADCADAGGRSIRDELPPSGELPGLRVVTVGPGLMAPGIWSHIRRFRPDVIHCHGGRAGQTVGRLRPLLPGRPSVLATMHPDYRRRWYQNHDAVVATTDWQAQEAKLGGFEGRIARVNLWQQAHPAPDRGRVAALRAEMGAELPGDMLVLGVGPLVREKGFDLLVSAVRGLDRPNLKLAIVGDGPEMGPLRQQAADCPAIRLMGFRGDVKDFYHAADLFCSPSRFEPFGLVFLEALDAGVPVVASASEGARTVLQPPSLEGHDAFGVADGVRTGNGLALAPLAALGDADDLAEALGVALNAVAQARDSGIRLRHRPALAAYSQAASLEALERLYAELVASAEAAASAEAGTVPKAGAPAPGH
ncbi:glycosyltransferase [Nitrospirillum pindoramense]|uniref:Glycosyltransferase involved in cell wall biosynthesis n=1 Tax=Nitrospirillum amazonense TaxID=28077 RepID=A0A560H8T9_9PROT|nr:glycosyltransferase [Nitrospirillum amazonense]TWB42757.1 glycosyltransferase involved in cell wall biosynthesis [Nitrospirillum amazonense]